MTANLNILISGTQDLFSNKISIYHYHWVSRLGWSMEQSYQYQLPRWTQWLRRRKEHRLPWWPSLECSSSTMKSYVEVKELRVENLLLRSEKNDTAKTTERFPPSQGSFYSFLVPEEYLAKITLVELGWRAKYSKTNESLLYKQGHILKTKNKSVSYFKLNQKQQASFRVSFT